MDNKTSDIIGTMEKWYAKAPVLPTNVKEVIVKFAPILALVFGILGVIGAIGGLGLLTVFSPLAMLGGAKTTLYGGGFISALFWLASAVLMLIAYPGINARKQKGWNWLFWSEVVSIVGTLLSYAILSGIVGGLIGFYILFQVKSYYK